MKANILLKIFTIAALASAGSMAQVPVVEVVQGNGSSPMASQAPPLQVGANYWSSCDGGGTGSGCSSSGCGSACASACASGCGGRSLFGGRLLSGIQPTESCFDCFISPVTNPFYFEDPRQLTELRPVFVNHSLPAAVGGGTVNAYAAQIRARLSENVSFIALKDGYFTSTNPLMTDGWADLGMGLKFSLFRDPVNQRLWSAGATFEAPSGSSGARQGLGSGNLNLFIASARRLGGSWNHMATSGLRLPMNGDTGSTSTFVSQHLSRPITGRFYVLTELNWFRWISSGTGGIPGIEFLDVANLGSSGVQNNNIVTWAAGGKFKTARRSEIGAAYELPISGRRDIMGNRVTAHWAIRY